LTAETYSQYRGSVTDWSGALARGRTPRARAATITWYLLNLKGILSHTASATSVAVRCGRGGRTTLGRTTKRWRDSASSSGISLGRHEVGDGVGSPAGRRDGWDEGGSQPVSRVGEQVRLGFGGASEDGLDLERKGGLELA